MAFYEQLAAARFAPGPYAATSPVDKLTDYKITCADIGYVREPDNPSRYDGR